VAIIAYDTSLHFFAVSPASLSHARICPVSHVVQEEGGEPSMLVVSDVDDVFLPKPSGLLINLDTSRAQITNLLERLPAMFAENHSVGSALGPALQAAQKLLVRLLPSEEVGEAESRTDCPGWSRHCGIGQPAFARCRCAEEPRG
jgi:protein transport protein SEC24